MRYYSSTAGEMTLQTGITASDTTILVNTTAGLPTSYPFTLILDYGASAEEVVDVTAAATTTLTVTRARDNTVAQAHAFGAKIRHGMTARDLRESRDHEDLTAAHGATGAVVGTTNAQTLTNKTLTSPTINGPTITNPTLTTGTVNPTTLQKGGVNVDTVSEVAVLTNKDLSSGTNTFPASLATDAEVSSAVSTHAGVTTGVHGVGAGAVVGTTLTQTLTGKTIDGGSNTLQNIAQAAITGLVSALSSITSRLTALESPTWSALTGFAANISSDATATAQYSVSSSGRVRMRGRVNHATNFTSAGSDVIAALPAGIRPNVERYFTVARNWASTQTSHTRITIYPDGKMQIHTPTTETSWISLDNIDYYIS